MSKVIYRIFILAALAPIVFSCQVEDPLEDVELGNMGITSVSAAFTGELYEDDTSASFTGYPDDNGNIVVEVPYYYPQSSDNVVTEDLLAKMRVVATMESGTWISPSLGVMDMRQSYNVTAHDAAGRTIDYVISAEITKLSGCLITSFVVTSEGIDYSAIISNENSTISIMTTEESLPNCTVAYKISDHATLSGYTEGMTITEQSTFTVTAHNGVSTKTYSVSFGTPEKTNYGARSGSGTELWTKYFSTNYGFSIPESDVPLRLAANGDYLYMLTGSGTIHKIVRATGEYVGTVTLPGGYTADSIVNDEAGHVLFATDKGYTNNFTIYWLDSMESEDYPKELLSSYVAIGVNYMGNIRVAGDITSEAVITSTTDVYRAGYAWQISGGVAQDPQTMQFGDVNHWNAYNGTYCPVSSKLSDGVFTMGYWSTYDIYYTTDFTNFTVALDTAPAGNENTNCLSTVTFNGARYLAYGFGAFFSWGECPAAYIVDSSNPYSMTSQLYGVPYSLLNLGGFVGSGVSNASSDVLLVVSEDGYYMDLYFTDANYGIITCYQFDCIQQ